MGKHNIPTIKSANAMFMTRNKLFLRSFLLTAKRKRVREFPATLKTDVRMKALHSAMPSALEGDISELVLSVEHDVLFTILCRFLLNEMLQNYFWIYRWSTG